MFVNIVFLFIYLGLEILAFHLVMIEGDNRKGSCLFVYF